MLTYVKTLERRCCNVVFLFNVAQATSFCFISSHSFSLFGRPAQIWGAVKLSSVRMDDSKLSLCHATHHVATPSWENGAKVQVQQRNEFTLNTCNQENLVVRILKLI